MIADVKTVDFRELKLEEPWISLKLSNQAAMVPVERLLRRSERFKINHEVHVYYAEIFITKPDCSKVSLYFR